MRVRTLDSVKKIKKRAPYLLVCHYCGESFYSYNNHTSCCSKPSCRKIKNKENRDKWKLKVRGKLGYSYKECAICGSLFEPTNSTAKYCSEECRIKGRRINKNKLQKELERCVKGKKNKHSVLYIKYTPDEFKHNIEKKFQNGMTWENYGQWHIDHIRPLCSFSFVNDDGSVNIRAIEEANSLDNLQPLWAEENLKKNRRWQNEG